MVRLDALTVSLVISLGIPILVGLLTKSSLGGGAKGLIMVILVAVDALVTQSVVPGGAAVISKETFVLWAQSLAVSVAMYKGLYKPLGVSSSPGGKLQNGGLG